MLRTDPNIPAPDAFYAALMALHRGLSPEQSGRVNAKLILLLANQIGDIAVLQAAIDKAAEGVLPEGVDVILAARA
jgi:hypothetical protein